MFLDHTKSIFRNENIRTYFNDELKLILPNGDIVRFVETRRNYTLAFCDDTAPIVARVGSTANSRQILPKFPPKFCPISAQISAQNPPDLRRPPPNFA